MGKRLSKIYTRTGDDGETGLGDGDRIAKDSPRVTAMGDIDERQPGSDSLVEEMAVTPEELDRYSQAFLRGALNIGSSTLGGEVSIPTFRRIQARHAAKRLKISWTSRTPNCRPWKTSSCRAARGSSPRCILPARSAAAPSAAWCISLAMKT
ncbi:MAG: hypothetical protein U5O39_19770 [Gammaproteobacteria bacterium]|nr:hypothetical protein [Gammaproteobacteria bacterium]